MKLHPKLKNHLISAMVTFSSAFGLFFFDALSNAEDIDLAFVKSIAIAALLVGVRAISREIVHFLNK